MYIMLQYFDGTYHSLQSPLYKWNGTALALAQTLFTHAAVRWLHLTCPLPSTSANIDSQPGAPQHFLAVLQVPLLAAPQDANESDSDPPVTRVSIFRYHDDQQRFVWVQVSH
jgi:hypothetical protein